MAEGNIRNHTDLQRPPHNQCPELNRKEMSKVQSTARTRKSDETPYHLSCICLVDRMIWPVFNMLDVVSTSRHHVSVLPDYFYMIFKPAATIFFPPHKLLNA